MRVFGLVLQRRADAVLGEKERRKKGKTEES